MLGLEFWRWRFLPASVSSTILMLAPQNLHTLLASLPSLLIDSSLDAPSLSFYL